MSQHGTPHMNNKRTPGGAVPETPGHMNVASSMGSSSSPGSAHQPQHVVMNSGRSVTDVNVTNARQLLNAYVYEFLVKSTLPDTARQFAAEADVPSVPQAQAAAMHGHDSAKTSPVLIGHPPNASANGNSSDKEIGTGKSNLATPQTPSASVSRFSEEHNLPGLALRMEAPQGFLFEWWQVFWDVYQAKNDRNSSSAAAEQYLHMQMMAQRQAQGQFAMEPAHPQGQMLMGPVTSQMGSSAHRPALVGPMGPGPQMTPHSQQPQRHLVGQQPPPNMDPRQQRYMMQMMMKQQQFQQQQLQQQKQQQQQQHGQHPHPNLNQIQHNQLQPSQLQPGQHQQLPQQPPGPPGPQSHPPLPQHPLPPQAQGQGPHPAPPPHLNQFPQSQQQQHIQLQQQQTPHQTPQQTPLQTPPVGQMPRPPPSQQPQPQPQHQLPQGMDSSMNNMAMNMKQQPMFMHSAGMTPAQNRIQQQAQTQMNNLRQQAAVAQHSGSGSAAAAAAAVAAAAAAAANSHPRDPSSPANLNGSRMNATRPQPVPTQSMNGIALGFQGNTVNGGPASAHFVANTPGTGPNMQMSNMQMNNMPMGPNGQPGRNSNALQDYQMQLMVLERQNKKRLDIARSNGSTESPGSIPQGHQPMQMVSNPQANAPPAPSPRVSNSTSPAVAAAKPKKEPATKRKQSAQNSAITPQSAGTDAGGVANNRSNGGAQVKRERSAPLTPAADAEGAKKKKKVSAGDSPKKPTKSASAAKKEKPTPKMKNEEEPQPGTTSISMGEPDFVESASSKMPPPDISFFQPTLGSVEVMGGPGGAVPNGEVNFFNTGGNPSIDDIDFDFNSFLDGGDDGLDDGLSGFNWGNPVEGD